MRVWTQALLFDRSCKPSHPLEQLYALSVFGIILPRGFFLLATFGTKSSESLGVQTVKWTTPNFNLFYRLVLQSKYALVTIECFSQTEYELELRFVILQAEYGA